LAFFTPHSISFKPALLLGLDIDQTAIRMVELSQGKDRRFQLERRAQLELPAGIVSDRQIQQPAQLAEYIAALAAQLGSKRKRVALALPADAVISRHLQVPAHLGTTALDALIAAEASGYLTVTPDQVRVDYQFSRIDVGSADTGQRDIVLAAARREQVDDRIAVVEAAGLIPAVLDIDLYAAYAACIHATAAAVSASELELELKLASTPALVALLKCDQSRTQLALFDQRQLLHHRELPGCDNRTEAMQIAIGAMRALPLATPLDMRLSHIFIGGDCGAARLEQLQHSTRAALAAQPIQTTTPQLTFSCSTVQPFAAMQIGKATRDSDPIATNENNIEKPDEQGAYLVACGLAMRRSTR
jgi:type IV pilus assembly protein PilM